MKKKLKLINNEKTSNKLKASKACDSTAVDLCYYEDEAECNTYAYDLCTKLDAALCSEGADDMCGSDFAACSGAYARDTCYGPYDYESGDNSQ